MIQSPHPAVLEKSGLHAPTWWATEQEYCTIIYWAIVANRYQRILEIGTFMGYTTWWLVEAASRINGKVTTVDSKAREVNFGLGVLTQIESPSDDFWTDQKYDFIYVDGGHSFEQAYRDIINAKAHLNEGGMIAVHDTSVQHDGIPEVRKALERAIPKVGGSWWYLEQGKGIAFGEF